AGPALVELVACPAPEISWQAEDILQRVASDLGNAPVFEATKEPVRREYRDRWAKWWSDNAGKVDLARIENDPPQRGWTAVAQMSTSKVYEIDREDKVSWSIDNRSGPIATTV